MIPFYRPYIGDDEVKAAERVLRSGWLTQGPEVEAFEEEAAEVLQTPKGYEAVAVSSCTAGLFLLGKVLGLGPDHKVAVPNLTFCATANAVLALGAQLYLLDTDENGLMSDLADFCGWYRAAIFVHFAGHHPRALTQERWIDYHILIHDQAHGFEPEAFAPNSVYSFFPNKNLTAGEGGLVVANRGVAEEIRERRNHGRRDTYTIRWPGSLNFRMTDLQAAILRVQLKRLPQMLAQKAAIERIYREFLDGWVKLPPDGVTHLFWIRHEKRDQIKSYLKMKGIETSIHYQPLSELGYCEMETPSSYKARSFPVSERIGRTTLSLPFYPDLTEEEAFMVCQAVREGISCKF